MTDKHKKARLLFWSKLTPEEKSKIFSERSKKMWKNKTPAERSKIMKKVRNVNLT